MPSEIKTALTDASKSALKEGRKQELAALRLFLAAIKQTEVDTRTDVDDPAVVQILTKLAKQRRESITQYEKAGRDDLVQQEQFELDLLGGYLPEAMSDAEIDSAIDDAIAKTGAASPKDMGKVMGVLKGALQGRADMGAVSGKVKQRLVG